MKKMVKVVKAIDVGVDDWGRRIVVTQEKNATTLKEVDGRWHRVTSYGEPDTPIGRNIKIKVIE